MGHKPVRDIDAISKIRAGDTEAFSALVEKYHRRLLNFIYTLTGDEAAVEDIGQEVFLSVYKSLDRFDEKRGVPFSAWLFIIARNRCISELRGSRDFGFVPLRDVMGRARQVYFSLGRGGIRWDRVGLALNGRA
jgi:RNA polymerase sigma-70 factor (ECF subfamily)